MQIYDGWVFVASSDEDSPDDRQVKFALGHVDKHEFANAAKVWPTSVKHVFASMFPELENEPPDFAWWNETADEDCDTPVTMAFTEGTNLMPAPIIHAPKNPSGFIEASNPQSLCGTRYRSHNPPSFGVIAFDVKMTTCGRCLAMLVKRHAHKPKKEG